MRISLFNPPGNENLPDVALQALSLLSTKDLKSTRLTAKKMQLYSDQVRWSQLITLDENEQFRLLSQACLKAADIAEDKERCQFIVPTLKHYLLTTNHSITLEHYAIAATTLAILYFKQPSYLKPEEKENFPHRLQNLLKLLSHVQPYLAKSLIALIAKAQSNDKLYKQCGTKDVSHEELCLNIKDQSSSVRALCLNASEIDFTDDFELPSSRITTTKIQYSEKLVNESIRPFLSDLNSALNSKYDEFPVNIPDRFLLGRYAKIIATHWEKLSKNKTSSAFLKFSSLLNHQDKFIRTDIASAIATIGNKLSKEQANSVFPMLYALLADDEYGFAQACAANAISAIKGHLSQEEIISVLPGFLSLLSELSDNAILVRKVAHAIAAIGNQLPQEQANIALPKLLPLLNSNNVRVRAAIAQAIYVITAARPNEVNPILSAHSSMEAINMENISSAAQPEKMFTHSCA